ncbi:MAG: nucleotide exchange factor GrpE [Flavobacteriales bacterium]|nr:nucleotide exchange factor GrpE [Flavobacteriales bacterium]
MRLKNPFGRSNKQHRTMDQEQLNNEPENVAGQESATQEEQQPDMAADERATDPELLKGELDALRTEQAALHDKYMRLFAEFDNFRKRTAKEKLEMLQMAGAGTLQSVLPVMDDLERAIANNASVDDAETVKQGVVLIHQKFMHILQGQGVKRMDAKGAPFDPELHEAITKAPAPEPGSKGSVLDVIESGYTLNDKVIRYAKVIVGE